MGFFVFALGLSRHFSIRHGLVERRFVAYSHGLPSGEDRTTKLVEVTDFIAVWFKMPTERTENWHSDAMLLCAMKEMCNVRSITLTRAAVLANLRTLSVR